MRIVMVGSGYVGLVSGTCFADFGHEVVCLDKDPAKIEALRAGRMPIYEPGLEALVAENVRSGRLGFGLDLAAAVAEADAVFIAVGTPSRRGDGFADLSYVYAAAREIAAALTGYTVIVTKSTVPVGTGDEVERIIREARPDAAFGVVSNPEFLREGAAIDDFKRPDRIVIGTDDARAEGVMREVYRPLYLNAAPILVTGRRTAELTKYAANAFLATKITFINEIADLCERVGADVQEVARGIGLDNRIGAKFLHAGPGYGGSCFPKDTLALVKTAQDAGTPMRIVETVVAVNDQRKRAMARKVIQACGGSVRGKTIALLGLTFKPNTDDMRDAPSLAIVAGLQDAGATVRAYDPEGMEQARRLLPDIAYAEDPYSCAEGADALVLVTEWNAFRALDLERLRATMAEPVLVDLRNVYRVQDVERLGFRYAGVGRAFDRRARLD
ncbi:UDP-glucose/GDP-mannose dehydrogenase family protein [Methylobacterium sp. WL30]|uniref:UDP-glucose dehydrogenase family protein n=1 Tax=unclassified Methylobacterium TaxID=2615210 RepID=UPI0011CC6290|nr:MULTISPECIES: UDP-glucose/GDP-mannose dehydrogenase family protein [unclassified Methylobacterium]MCJ2076748.1 UDP-glucose/GDP-mannose dehydrogenase family protein [Methylobacterium sp. E-016]TXM93790.1 UDP-glucose/GDP-mannose dehydrogenase family protein [Methylobacterium sp. WL116]TXN42025.1 UDP-glucose/GDP-mannose dehydrogenase family protein [Methylobacterium sp. WL93]TXN52683.1 UDP-glucose/GDP-mannose dehydrogenase family protein [Methylobacterium sp. WL119]TXN69953.1 UDP-glucose/GDP-m